MVVRALLFKEEVGPVYTLYSAVCEAIVKRSAVSIYVPTFPVYAYVTPHTLYKSVGVIVLTSNKYTKTPCLGQGVFDVFRKQFFY